MRTRVENTHSNGDYSQYGTVKEQSAVAGSVLRAKVLANNDPLCMGRVKLDIPTVYEENMTLEERPWASVTQIGSGAGAGSVIIPEVGATVMVAFENGDENRPVVVGSVYGSSSTTSAQTRNTLSSQEGESTSTGKIRTIGQTEVPLEGQDINCSVVYKSHNGSVLYMDNTTNDLNVVLRGAKGEHLHLAGKKVTLKTSEGSHLYMDDKHEDVILESKGGWKADLCDREGFAEISDPEDKRHIRIQGNQVTLQNENTHLDVNPQTVDIVSGSSNMHIQSDKIVLERGGSSVTLDEGVFTITSGGCSIQLSGGVATVTAGSINLNAPVIYLGDDSYVRK